MESNNSAKIEISCQLGSHVDKKVRQKLKNIISDVENMIYDKLYHDLATSTASLSFNKAWLASSDDSNSSLLTPPPSYDNSMKKSFVGDVAVPLISETPSTFTISLEFLDN